MVGGCDMVQALMVKRSPGPCKQHTMILEIWEKWSLKAYPVPSECRFQLGWIRMRMQILVKIETQNIFCTHTGNCVWWDVKPCPIYLPYWQLHTGYQEIAVATVTPFSCGLLVLVCTAVWYTTQQRSVLKTFLSLPDNHHSIGYWMKDYYNYDYDY